MMMVFLAYTLDSLLQYCLKRMAYLSSNLKYFALERSLFASNQHFYCCCNPSRNNNAYLKLLRSQVDFIEAFDKIDVKIAVFYEFYLYTRHYENMPIQRSFSAVKNENNTRKNLIVLIFMLETHCGYTLEPPRHVRTASPRRF